MYFLAGAAAGSAIDLIATLKQTLWDPQAKTGVGTGAAPAKSPFDVAGQAGAVAPSASDGTTAGTAPIAAGTMNALLAAQARQSGGLSSELFSLLDGDGDGAVSKAEFETVFARSGNTSRADSVFGRIDADQNGSISAGELAAALKPGHHRRHPDAVDGAGSAGGGARDRTGASSKTVTNADGSVTTTITYEDGSTVSMTQPATATANNFLERMIQRQAQMLGASTAGQSLAVTA